MASSILLLSLLALAGLITSHPRRENFQARGYRLIEETANRNIPIPSGPFSCQGRPYGFYADILSNCRDFHICQPYTASTVNGPNDTWQHSTISCPRYTVFNQMTMTCTREEELSLPCRQQIRLYDINLQLSKPKPTTSTVASVEEVAAEEENSSNENGAITSANHHEELNHHYNVQPDAAPVFTNGHHLILKPVVYPGQPTSLLQGMLFSSSHVIGSIVPGPYNYANLDTPAATSAATPTAPVITPPSVNNVQPDMESEVNPMVEITNAEDMPMEEVFTSIAPREPSASTIQPEPSQPRVIPESPMARARRTHLHQ